jgi:7-cyano-7-deazaguanine synthase
VSNPSGVVVLSGGMDSVTVLHRVIDEGYDANVISFNYGQKHSKELQFAQYWAQKYSLNWRLVDLTSVTSMLQSSALVNTEQEVPEGHYAADNMKATVVPNRNMIMISIASAWAVDQKAELVAFGVHSGDHDVYPDCRPGFVNDLEMAIHSGNDSFINDSFQLYTPYIMRRKEDIALDGDRLGVDWTKTWSCYKGGELHCGKCGTCVERKEAFKLADLEDPTEYETERTGIPGLDVPVKKGLLSSPLDGSDGHGGPF